MSPRPLFVLILLALGLVVALGVGYAGGLLWTKRSIDRAPAAGPGDGEAAHEALEAINSDEDPESRAEKRRAFLERWPDSWLAREWSEARR